MKLDRTFAQINTILNNVWNGQYVQFNQLGRQTVPFNASVKLDKQYKTIHTINGVTAYTLDESVNNDLGNRIDFIMSDGINTPTFDLDKFEIQWFRWLNEPNRKHRIFFEKGESKINVWVQYLVV
jgi:hypothetical protein